MKERQCEREKVGARERRWGWEVHSCLFFYGEPIPRRTEWGLSKRNRERQRRHWLRRREGGWFLSDTYSAWMRGGGGESLWISTGSQLVLCPNQHHSPWGWPHTLARSCACHRKVESVKKGKKGPWASRIREFMFVQKGAFFLRASCSMYLCICEENTNKQNILDWSLDDQTRFGYEEWHMKCKHTFTFKMYSFSRYFHP